MKGAWTKYTTFTFCVAVRFAVIFGADGGSLWSFSHEADFMYEIPQGTPIFGPRTRTMKTRYTLPLLGIALSLSLGTQAQQVQKCCGTSNSTFLLGNMSYAPHTQSLYPPVDLVNVTDGWITDLYFRYGSTGDTIGNTLGGLLIRMGQTSATAFANSSFLTDLDTALYATEFTIPPGQTGEWFSIPMQVPFLYNANQTLVLDIWFTSSTTLNFGTYGTANNDRKLYALTLDATTGSLSSATWQDLGFDLDPISGINEQKPDGMQLVPMPGDQQLRVVRSDDDLGKADLFLLDASGRQLANHAFTQGTRSMTLNLAGMATGIYIVQLVGSNGTVNTRRFHKAN